ncbi:MAG: aspartate-alanine antiporter [Betaproteobacteria bacterium PRO3]|nr:aspartate-alanine antiporter [Betaproteobacteria bacterium PRO3]
MEWLAVMFGRYPELPVFLAVGLGYWAGAWKFRGFGLGPVTSSLVAGLAIGYAFKVEVSSTAKSILFLLFLFAIGYSVGPKFFKAMKGDGLRWGLLAAVMAFTGLATAYAAARFLGLDAGFAGGLVSGALTESPAIGTATEAIRTLPIPVAEQQRLIGHVAVADALCYVFGAFGVIAFCSIVGPWLLGIDVKAEAERVERSMGFDRSKPGVVSGWRSHETRAYRLREGGAAVGRTVSEFEALAPGTLIFVLRLRRGGELIAFDRATRLAAGDTVALSGRREALTGAIAEAALDEVDDREVLDLPMMTLDVFVTDRRVVGESLAELAEARPEFRGVHVRSITRGGHDVPVALMTRIERGDFVRLTGPEAIATRVAEAVGQPLLPSDTTDFVALGFGIFAGALVGASIVLPLAGLHISLGTSVGTLIAGLLVGHVHSVKPWFARIPAGAVEFMISFGLATFVAMIGLSAGPHFVEALREAGVGLFFAGMLVTSLPLVVGLYVGRYLLKLEPILLLGGIAGSLTMTAALAALQERSGSPVAVLGYSGTVAIGHILLTTWGSVIVKLVG